MPWAGRGGGLGALAGVGGGGSPDVPRHGGLLMATCRGAPCTSTEGGGYGLHPCALSRAEGPFSTHVHATIGWKDRASTPEHVSTRWRVQWVLCHCSPPVPLPTEGLWECYNSCTQAVVHVLPLLYPGYCCRSGSADVLQPTPALLPSEGLWGVLQQPHLSYIARTAVAAARVVQQFWHCIGPAAKPAQSPIEGRQGCCNCRTLAAAHVLQLPQPVSCRTVGVAAAPLPTPTLLLTEGLRGAGGAEGGGARGVGGAGGGGHLNAGRRVLLSTPVHYSTG